jgi:cytochrome b6-f complex iron-sulfur subunit
MSDEHIEREPAEHEPATGNREPTPEPAEQQSERGVDRRRFLNGAWKTLGVVLIAEGVWTSYDLLNPEAAAGGGVIDAGPVGDFEQEGSVAYFLNGRFYVTNHQGGLRALYQKCPHLGCRVPFCSSSQQFECPCHGSVYNVIGEYLQGPAPRGMDRFEIRIQGGRVMVDTGALVEGPARGVLTGPSSSGGPSCVAGGEGGGSAPSPTPAEGSASPGPGDTGTATGA